MHRALSIGLSLLPALAAGLPAQSIVVPRTRANTEGNSATADPFAPMFGRYQQILAGSEIGQSAVVRSIGLRMDGGIRVSLLGTTLPNYTVRMAHAARTPATMSTTFQTNIAGAATVVFQGSIVLPNQPPHGSPAPFNMVTRLMTPFAWSRNRGDLLVEWERRGRSQLRRGYPFDAERGEGAAEARVFGTNGRTQRGETYSVAGDSRMLHPGGHGAVVITRMAAGYPIVTLFGASNMQWGSVRLPLDLAPLGGPGQRLLVSGETSVRMTSIPVLGQFVSTYTFPIPNQPALAGGRFYAQPILADPGANALGMVAGSGIAYRIAGNRRGAVNLMGHRVWIQPTGEFSFGDAAGGVVMQLGGTFQ